MYEPKNLHDGLRWLRVLNEAIERDLTSYMASPEEFDPEYFKDVLLAARQAVAVVDYIRNELKGDGK